MSETYKCVNGNYCQLNVNRGVTGRFVFRSRGASFRGVAVVLKNEDIPRLIAQLTAAQGEPDTIEELPIKDIWSIEDGGGSTVYLNQEDETSILIGIRDGSARFNAVLTPEKVAKLSARLNEYARRYGQAPLESTEPPEDTTAATIDELAAGDLEAAINAEIARAGFLGSKGMLDSVTQMADEIKNQEEVIASMCMREHKQQVKIDELSNDTCKQPDPETMAQSLKDFHAGDHQDAREVAAEIGTKWRLRNIRGRETEKE